MTSDKQKYGVQLRAEPDHKVLGAKLKGALKAVSEQIRQLTDEQLTAFLQTGTISVGGYTLGSEDLRVMFTSTTAQSGNGDSSQYEAHSDGQVFFFVHPGGVSICVPDADTDLQVTELFTY